VADSCPLAEVVGAPSSALAAVEAEVVIVVVECQAYLAQPEVVGSSPREAGASSVGKLARAEPAAQSVLVVADCRA